MAWEGNDSRIIRGGGFTFGARAARSAERGSNSPSAAGGVVGVRAARAVAP